MFKFSDIVEIQRKNKSISKKKKKSDVKEMTENIDNTGSETEFASLEDPLNMHRCII